jgi:AbrB family transcriptional regulator (stage V sporulation protein T)
LKATGIVRRIDDLGRVVIPKEIRRTLRIREGDPLEIFTDREGGIILKKYSPINELSDFAKEYAEALHQSIGHPVIICDRDSVVAVAGTAKKEYLDKRVSDELEKVFEERKIFVFTGKEGNAVPIIPQEEEKTEYKAQIIAPIIAEGDAVGAVVIMSKEPNVTFGELERKLAETASTFLGKQMEQ